MMARALGYVLAIFACLLSSGTSAQDIEPRRWTVLPVGLNVIAAGYGRVSGDVLFDPVLRVQDATVDGHAAVVSYVRSFAVLGKTARIDAAVPWSNMRWAGLLDGEPATVSRVGLSDPTLRLSVILKGDKPDRTSASNTVIGAAVQVGLPLGKYLEDRLLNLGQNRYFLRPQFGVLHTRRNWSYELTGSVFLFGDNDDFVNGSTLKQDPLYALQSHLIYVFDKPGYWAALSAGYGWKGASSVDGVDSNDSKRQFLSAMAFGVPISQRQGIRFSYIRTRTNTDKGADLDSFSLGWSYAF